MEIPQHDLMWGIFVLKKSGQDLDPFFMTKMSVLVYELLMLYNLNNLRISPSSWNHTFGICNFRRF
jgi:hypothetical protein